MKHAALYLRQSKSDDEGIERQLARTTALATARGWTVGDPFIDDDTTASKPRGPQTAWGRMLAASDEYDVVIGVDLDRVVRSTRDLNTLIDHGLALVTLDGEIDLSTADGEFRASMLAAIARFEVRRKGERQTRANGQRAAKGSVPKGTRLTGYTSDGEVVPDEAERVVALFEGFAAGETLRGLSRTHDLTSSTVRTILTNPRYCGRRVYKGQVVGTGDWTPLVSADLFDLVNRRLADPARAKNRTGSTARKHLGTSLFECGCGAGTVRTAGSGGRYWCPSCGLVRRMEPVDDFVLQLLYARLTRQDAREALTPHPDLEPLRQRATALRGRRADLVGLVADGTFTKDQVQEATKSIDAELADIEATIARSFAPVASLTEDEVAAGLDSLSLDRKRALVAAVMTVTLHRGRQGSKTFDPATVETTWR